MSHYQTIEDFLKDANEAINFYSEYLDKNHGNEYYAAPWMEAEVITGLFEYAANEISMSFFEYDVDIPCCISDIPHKEHDDELRRIVYLCAQYASNFGSDFLNIYSIRSAFRKENKHELIEELLSFAPHEKIFATLTLVASYLSYKMFKSKRFEDAIDFVASAQVAFVSMIDLYLTEEDIFFAKEMDKNRRKEAAERGAKKRIEARFKEEIFIPSWQDWKNGELYYRTQDAFLSEMNRQSAVYLKQHRAEKEYISSRTFLRWAAELKI